MLEVTRNVTPAPEKPENALQEQYFGHEHVTVIEPGRGGRWLDRFAASNAGRVSEPLETPCK
jgi:hypothetical protein